MPRFFVKENQIKQSDINIVGQDVNHIKNVLRLKANEEIEICNYESEKTYLCKIQEIQKDYVLASILEEIKNNVESNVKVTIFQGLPKSDKMELIIQKSVELGVYDITPTEMKRCVVKLNDKEKTKKILRWQKISEVAAKQCGRNIIPKINSIINIQNVCNLVADYDIVLVAYENERENTLRNEIDKVKNKIKSFGEEIKIAVVIGPEGGLEEKDVEKMKQSGAKIITLGTRILRTETVALNILSILMYELGK